MPTFQDSELLPEHEILQYKIPAATEDANQCSDPEEKQAEHGMGYTKSMIGNIVVSC
jgi:hypothetical protein